ncbi:FAD-binding oxidoreductase [Kribbella sandramycini]|uniref:FAD-binding oxidoreductase n=1 Tax=Kribbella sandramycini TaxID=60450 RepID=A0A7Y4P234_9ACTN|nr:FAD-dependent oxidoreductase [Kribbella sandramycini]MBB6566605.1 glycine/D-amino acid oxidase-like deaminating enzyme [Kribbella sandramycini]NOL42740.1 FAD-binding oxidoreductase [Kribbella sandramycini]
MTYDVLVVGNDAFGLSLGLALARRGTQVAVVGARRPEPAVGLVETFGGLSDAHEPTKVAWSHKSAQLWPEWLNSLDSDVQTADGSLVILNTMGLPDVDSANFAAVRAALEQYGEPFEVVDPAEFDWLDPEPTARPLQALYLPNEFAVDTAELMAGLERAFQAAGGVLIVEDIVQVGDGVELHDGTSLTAGAVVLVNTAAPAAAETLQLVDSAEVSVVVDTEGDAIPPYLVRTPRRAFAAATYAAPLRVGQLQLGGTEVVASEPVGAAPVGDVLHVLNAAARQLRRDLGESSVQEIQLTNRPVAIDGLPLIGETALPGVWLLNSSDLSLAPLLADELATALRGEEPTLDLTPFGPSRAPISALTRAGAVAATVTQLLAGGYESNWTTPVEWPALLEATLVTELHRNPPEVTTALQARLR